MAHELEERLRDDPDDEQTWLVYGDWLMERGDPRGLGISVRMSDPDALLRQLPARELQDCHWKYGLLLGASFASVRAFEQVCAHPLGVLLREASFRGLHLGEDELQRLLDCPLERLRALALPGNGLCSVEIQALCDMPSLSRLTALDLHHNRLDDESASILARAPHLSALAWLHLADNEIGDEGAQTLAGRPGLEHLFLGGNLLGPSSLGIRARIGPQRRWSPAYPPRGPRPEPRYPEDDAEGLAGRSFYVLECAYGVAGADKHDLHVYGTLQEIERALAQDIAHDLYVALGPHESFALHTFQRGGLVESLDLAPFIRVQLDGWPAIVLGSRVDLGYRDLSPSFLVEQLMNGTFEAVRVEVDWEAAAPAPLQEPIAQPDEMVFLEVEGRAFYYGWNSTP